MTSFWQTQIARQPNTSLAASESSAWPRQRPGPGLPVGLPHSSEMPQLALEFPSLLNIWSMDLSNIQSVIWFFIQSNLWYIIDPLFGPFFDPLYDPLCVPFFAVFDYYLTIIWSFIILLNSLLDPLFNLLVDSNMFQIINFTARLGSTLHVWAQVNISILKQNKSTLWALEQEISGNGINVHHSAERNGFIYI